MVSGLMTLALGGTFLLWGIAATIDVVRDRLPAPLPEGLSLRARRVMAWMWPVPFLSIGIPATIGGLYITPLISAADWPWTVLFAGLFLLFGVMQIIRSLRAPRTPQHLPS